MRLILAAKETNKRASTKLNDGRGAVGKVAVVGMRDRQTNKEPLHGFIHSQVKPDAKICTDEHRAYEGLLNRQSVKHSVSEYVKGQAHTSGIGSFWSLLKRGYYGTYHKMIPAHHHRYVAEFEGRHNGRRLDTLRQMGEMAKGADCKSLRYEDLIRNSRLTDKITPLSSITNQDSQVFLPGNILTSSRARCCSGVGSVNRWT